MSLIDGTIKDASGRSYPIKGRGRRGRTQQFIKEWLQMALSPIRARKIAENESARKLIHEREKQLKGNLARLDNPEALARWSGDAGTWKAAQV